MKLLDFLLDHKIAVAPANHEHARLGWTNIDCPRCTRGALHFRYGIPTGGFVGNCWACGKIPVVEALAALTGLRPGIIRKTLDGLEDARATPAVKHQGQLILPKYLEPLWAAHKQYLRLVRGFDLHYLERLYDVRLGTAIAPELPWRVFIPIYQRGVMVSWTTRSISNEVSRRYWAAESFQESIPHKELLFGEDLCRQVIMVCEGPLDAMKIGPGAVATFGTAITHEQVNKISKYPLRIICLDNEPLAQKTARMLCHQLEAWPGTTINIELDAKDPGSASARELDLLRKYLH